MTSFLSRRSDRVGGCERALGRHGNSSSTAASRASATQRQSPLCLPSLAGQVPQLADHTRDDVAPTPTRRGSTDPPCWHLAPRPHGQAPFRQHHVKDQGRTPVSPGPLLAGLRRGAISPAGDVPRPARLSSARPGGHRTHYSRLHGLPVIVRSITPVHSSGRRDLTANCEFGAMCVECPNSSQYIFRESTTSAQVDVSSCLLTTR